MASYAPVTWTGGDTITESKLDNMVNNDRAEDAHESGVDLLNDTPLRGKNAGGTLQNIAKVNSTDELELGDADLDRMIFLNITQEEEYDAGNSGTSKTLDWENGGNQKLTLTGNVTLSYSNVQPGDKLTIHIVQDATGGRTITWPGTTKAVDGVVDIATGANDESWVFVKAVSASEFHILGQVSNLESV